MSALMALRRLVITPLMRGPAIRHSTTNRTAKLTTSQKIWLGKVSVLKGGKPPGACLGVSVEACSGSAMTLLREEDDQRDDQAEQARRFAQRKAQEQVGGLGGGGAGIAQGARKIGAEHIADADAGADQRDAGDAGANHLCSCEFHFRKSLRWFSGDRGGEALR